MDRDTIDAAVQEKRNRKRARERRAENRRQAKIQRVNRTKQRVRLIQGEEGQGILLLPKPFFRYFLGFDIVQGFWFAMVTGIVAVVGVAQLFYAIAGQFGLSEAMRIIMSAVLTIDSFALLYLVFAWFRYPPVRLYITASRNYALFVRRGKRPRSVGRVGDLYFSIYLNEKTGWGSVEIRGAGRARVFMKLRQADVITVRSFCKRNNIRD